MKLGELAKKLDEILDISLAYSWDNVGLLVGQMDAHIKKISLTLELCDEVIEDAVKNGSNLIITHHPLIFTPIKTVISSNIKQEYVIKLIKNNIALYTAHTNFDMIKGGLNDYVINLLDVSEVSPLEDDENINTLGRVAKLNKPMYASKFLNYLEEKFDMKNARLVCKKDRLIEKIALITGAGAEFINIASQKADLFITGDLKYHDAQDAYQSGLCIIDAGHYDTEKHFGNAMKIFLEQNLSNQIEIEISNLLDNPFRYMGE